jgi:uncharacterized protein (AIM24 family)
MVAGIRGASAAAYNWEVAAFRPRPVPGHGRPGARQGGPWNPGGPEGPHNFVALAPARPAGLAPTEGIAMEEQVLGTALPVLSISLGPGESVVAEAGEFSWMTDSIQMSTSLFLSTYTATDSAGTIAFASKLPGSILGVDAGPGAEYLVHRRGFLAGTPGIEISAGFRQSFTAGIFAGEGFALQRIAGQGRAWIELAGEVVRHDLAAGQSLRAHPGHVGMFTASVSFQVMRVPGITNRYFAGDAHHFAVLSGPGTVWLQSMPMPMFAAALAPYLPRAQGGHGVEGGAMGPVKTEVLGQAAVASAANIAEELKSFTK